jgi:hypothetical protein
VLAIVAEGIVYVVGVYLYERVFSSNSIFVIAVILVPEVLTAVSADLIDGGAGYVISAVSIPYKRPLSPVVYAVITCGFLSIPIVKSTYVFVVYRGSIQLPSSLKNFVVPPLSAGGAITPIWELSLLFLYMSSLLISFTLPLSLLVPEVEPTYTSPANQALPSQSSV